MITGADSRDLELGNDVNKKVEMSYEISTYKGLLDVCHNEHHAEGAVQAQVGCKRAVAKGCDA